MKNLSAIPRPSLFAAFTILITLVVCLAGFTGAEVFYTNYQGDNENRQRDEDYLRKQSPLKDNNPYLQEPSKTRGEELSKQTIFASYLKNYGRDDALDNLLKRHSDDFGESDDFDSERESDDGYGYDDDEYYHFDFKRNDDSKEISKGKEDSLDILRKDVNKNQKLMTSKNLKDHNQKESETERIELLNYKESHPIVGGEPVQSSIAPQIGNPKPLLHDNPHKKTPSDPSEALKMGDFKENSAISEKVKQDRKEETEKAVGGGVADQKAAEVKKDSKSVEDKENVKLKEPKVEVDSEKKEKESNLKEGKESVANKNIKEPAKTSEDKENHEAKTEKLSEGAKLEKNNEKFSSKNKEGETAKINNEDKDGSTLAGKISSETGNSNGVSQINNRASFVSNDYKDDPNALKVTGAKEEEKNLEELRENEKNIGFNDYRDLLEQKDNLRGDEGSRNYGFMNTGEDTSVDVGRGLGKANDYLSLPGSFDVRNDGDFFKKRESWKERPKIQHDPLPEHQPQSSDSQGKNPYRFNFPPGELENTEYHKNYIKSLRRYKGMEDSPKVLNMDPPNYNKSGIRESQKRKRSQPKKRKLIMYEESPYGQEENYKNSNDHWNIRRRAQSNTDMSTGESESYMGQQTSSQAMPNFKIVKEDAGVTLKEPKKYESQNNSYRWRRGSPQKLEYEIKVINQNPQGGKSGLLSSNNSKRKKKDLKAKLMDHNENKNPKKYTYSQVSLDDLTKLTQNKYGEDKKIKRRVSSWEQKEPFGGGSRNTKSHVRVRGVPSGYYSNRVKFGQKRLSGNEGAQTANANVFDEETLQTSSDISLPQTSFDQNNVQAGIGSSGEQLGMKNRFSSVYDGSPIIWTGDRNFIPWDVEVRNPDYKHDPMKRYDSNSFLNKEYGSSPLFLVKKARNGDRLAKTFLEETNSDENLEANQLGKIFSQDHDYVFLKRTDKNKFQKFPENADLGNSLSYESSFPGKKTNVFGSKQTVNRGLNVRSDHWGEDIKKYSSKFYNSEGKSGLKKTFEKLKDFADFFKDGEQEAPENQRQAQEKKEGSDIVFSEDKLPDPIVLTNEINKITNLKSKPPNSMSSISSNFKTADQGKKDMIGDQGRNFDFAQNSWEPALKSAFPEAKSISSIQRNGNEIIVLDFNRNQIKPEHINRVAVQCDSHAKGKQSVLGPVGSVPVPPITLAGDRQVEVIINDGPIPLLLQQNPSKFASDKKNQLDKNNGEASNPEEGLTVLNSAEQMPSMSIPFNQLSQLPGILKSLSEKKSNFKVLTKKSASLVSEGSPNLGQFLKDFRDLTETSNKDGSYSKAGKYIRKRNLHEGNMAPGTFPEPSNYADPHVQYLGNFLHNLGSDENAGTPGNKEIPFGAVSAMYKNVDELPRSDRWYPRGVEYGANPVLKHQNQWTSADERREDYIPINLKNTELAPGKEIENSDQSTEEREDDESDYQDELWQELSAASNKIQRLRREGMSKRKLRKTIEDALSFRQRRQSDKSNSSPDSKITDSAKNLASDSNTANSENQISPEKSGTEDDLSSVAGDVKTQKASNLQSEFRPKGDGKESPEPENTFSKSDLESHLRGSPESKNEEGLIGSNESGVGRRMRRHVHRRKRSPSHDIKNKVSRTEVENSILKNLVEDNYQSVYSPGIKRKLLSTEDEPEDADSYYGTDGREKGKAAGESRPQCLKNKLNKCIDPMILELFGSEDPENEKGRDRRSLTTAFHSNYKREIDLDESMPNDFQNFLVTSLGGFGSQKREVVKKEEALWEGKESSQSNFNQIVDNSAGGKDNNEDSALKKREAPDNNIQKRRSYKSRDYYENLSDSISPNLSAALPRKKARSQDKPPRLVNAPEFEEEKIPTQIRIKITNSNAKEKKSFQPIIDERKTSSNELKTPLKKKEFSDKNKLSLMRLSNPQKLHQFPKTKYFYEADVRRGGREDSSGKQKVYVSSRTYRRGRRNKKKLVPESPVKPAKDFSAYDENTVENLIQRYLADQNLYGSSTTKTPVSNHLPQVETVYNPSQGTNKAQLKESLPLMSSVFHKNSLKDKDASAFYDGSLVSYNKDKGSKSKEEKSPKEFEDVDWKPFTTTRMRQEAAREGSKDKLTHKNHGSDIGNERSMITNSAAQHHSSYYKRPFYKSPNSGYFYHAPSINTNSVYDAIKLRQAHLNRNPSAKEHGLSKLRGKLPTHSINSYYKQDEKERTPTRYAYDPFSGKKSFSQKYKSRDNFLLKNEDSKTKPDFSASEHEFLKVIDEDKQPIIFPFQFFNLDSARDPDYFETAEEEYIDEDGSRQEPLLDDLVAKNPAKKISKAWEVDYRQPYELKNSGLEDVLEDDEDELDEDYEENNGEDDLDDYSLFSGPAKLGKVRSRYGSEQFSNPLHPDGVLYSYSNSFYPKVGQYPLQEYELRGSETKNSKSDDLVEPGIQKMTLTDNKIHANKVRGTMGALKKANENSNIFGQNLLKNLNRFNYDETSDKLQNEKNYENLACENVKQLRMKIRLKPKRSEEFSRTDDGIFYASKTAKPGAYFPQGEQMRTYGNRENIYYKPAKRNPLNAELRGAENEFEYEAEENGKHFNGNIINSGKGEREEEENSGKAEEDGGTNKRDSEDSDKAEDVKENLEEEDDDGETVSEENVLENVIGKYIMRKSMKIAPEPKLKETNMPSEEMRKDSDSVSEDSKKHKSSKRSVENQVCEGQIPIGKSLRKRLSSGHLTENNYRKYHKKNFNRKRFADLESDTDTGTANANEKGESKVANFSNNIEREKADENEKVGEDEKRGEEKRSALGLFRKLTNKDKDIKKMDVIESWSAGFEPLYSDKKLEEMGKSEQAALAKERQLSLLNKNGREASFISRSDGAEGYIAERGKSREQSVAKSEGPWRLELNKKNLAKLEDKAVQEKKNSFKKQASELGKKNGQEPEGELRAFLVISKNVKTLKRSLNSAEAQPLPYGAAEREVGNSYRRKSDEGAGNPDKQKRSLETSGHRLTCNREDDLATQVPIKENRISIEEKNRALHDTPGLSEGDSKAQRPPRAQRNTENSSFVSAEADKEKFPSKRKLNNRKSVFPPRSEANIIGGGGQSNEVTSEYLGRQIVNAILAHVSSDPRFKESIAPGLAIKTPSYREGFHDIKRALSPSEFTDNTQFLQKVKDHVRKKRKKPMRDRICNKIDKQSKQFLDFLVKGSKEGGSASHESNINSNLYCSSGICSSMPQSNSDSVIPSTAPPVVPASQPQAAAPLQTQVVSSAQAQATLPVQEAAQVPPVSLPPATEGTTNSQSEVTPEGLENLKKKQALLLKLIEDYHHLSVLEKQNLELHYQYIIQQLENTNRALNFKNNVNYLEVTDIIQVQAQNKTNLEPSMKARGFTSEAKPNAKDLMLNKTSCGFPLKYYSYPIGAETPCDGFERTVTQDVRGLKSGIKQNVTNWPRVLYSFEPADPTPDPGTLAPSADNPDQFQPANKKDEYLQRSNTPGPFQKAISSNNDTFNVKNPSALPPVESQPNAERRQSAIAPESFDLLSWNGDLKSPAPDGFGSVRIKQSLPKNPRYRITEMGNPFRYGLEHFPTQFLSGYKSTELNKLGSGDMAGLQLSLKYGAPWRSNLDLSKGDAKIGGTSSPVLPVAESAPLTQVRPSKQRLRDSSSEGAPSTLLKGRKYPRRTIFPLKLEKKKVLPLHTLKKNVQNDQRESGMKYSLERYSEPGRRARKNPFSDARRKEKRLCETGSQRETGGANGGAGLDHATGISIPASRRRLDILEMGSRLDDVPFQNRGKIFQKENEKN